MIKSSPNVVSGWTCPQCSTAPQLILYEGKEVGKFLGCPNKDCMYTMPYCPDDHSAAEEDNDDEGFSVYCSICDAAIKNGESAYASTTGTIEEECYGFMTDDKPWLTVACEECGVKITEAICNIYPGTQPSDIKSNFSEEELLVLLEAARIALLDRELNVKIAEDLDLSDDYLYALREKLVKVLELK